MPDPASQPATWTSATATRRNERLPSPREIRWSWLWAVSILAVWAIVAWRLDQPLWAPQHSRDLQAYGALRGDHLSAGTAWKLFASQWLHVKFAHMAFNALIIGTVGQGVERRLGPLWTIGLGIGLGAAGQLANAVVMPDAYVSGASQAYLALAGVGVMILRPSSLAWAASVLGALVAVGLDLFVSDHGALKIGHLLPFALGLGCGVLFRRGPSLPPQAG